MKHAERVAADNVAHAAREQHVRHRNACCADPDHQHPERLERAPGELDGVEQGRENHDGRPVLVVVEDGDVQVALELGLDLEAARRRDVLEVDAAEPGRDQLDGPHDLRGVVAVDGDREGVDTRELLEQAALALHHRHRGLRADVPEPEYGGSVGDYGNGVPLDRVVVGALRIFGDRHAHARDARRVRHRQVVARLQCVLIVLLDLAALVDLEGAVDSREHPRAVDRVDGVGYPDPVLLARRVHREVAQFAASLGSRAAGGLDEAAGRGDHVRDRANGVRTVDLDGYADAVLRARDVAHVCGPSRNRASH